jgi:hypothetical protein
MSWFINTKVKGDQYALHPIRMERLSISVKKGRCGGTGWIAIVIETKSPQAAIKDLEMYKERGWEWRRTRTRCENIHTVYVQPHLFGSGWLFNLPLHHRTPASYIVYHGKQSCSKTCMWTRCEAIIPLNIGSSSRRSMSLCRRSRLHLCGLCPMRRTS